MRKDGNLRSARDILRVEGKAIFELADRLGGSFSKAVEIILEATGEGRKGRVIVAGMGKAGIVGQKISATLASTGTPSWSIHPADTAHGDLGRITPDDVVIALSKSGETTEISRMLGHVKRFGARVISITCQVRSTLGEFSDVCIDLGDVPEACPLGLAPSTSTTVMLALGDALALTVLKRRGFTKEQFAAFHPGGSLGKTLIRVEDVMRTGAANVTVRPGATVRETVAAIAAVPGKVRAGAACVVDGRGKLVGFFTDGDLRRKLQEFGGKLLSMPMSRVMTRRPTTIKTGSLAADASRILEERKFDELPVVDARGRLAGLIDIQDLLLMGFM